MSQSTFGSCHWLPPLPPIAFAAACAACSPIPSTAAAAAGRSTTASITAAAAPASARAASSIPRLQQQSTLNVPEVVLTPRAPVLCCGVGWGMMVNQGHKKRREARTAGAGLSDGLASCQLMLLRMTMGRPARDQCRPASGSIRLVCAWCLNRSSKQAWLLGVGSEFRIIIGGCMAGFCRRDDVMMMRACCLHSGIHPPRTPQQEHFDSDIDRPAPPTQPPPNPNHKNRAGGARGGRRPEASINQQ